MAERQSSKMEKKRDRQPISIPFIWEEKPGMPIKDWKPTVQPVNPVVPPVKLVASVPFEWEEKPMIQIPGPNLGTRNLTGPVTPPVKLVVSVPFGWEEKPGTPIPGFIQRPTFSPLSEYKIIFSSPPRDSGQGENERDESSDSELDVWSCASDDSFSSAPSLLANGLISSNILSRALPVMKSKSSGQLASPGSPASETDGTSSYAAGTAGLVGSSFLEWLFPLLMPNSGREVGYLEKNPTQRENEQVKELLQERKGSQVRRPLLTLGELIVMSRRRSCQRKVAKTQKQPSMDFIKRSNFGCFNFRAADIAGLHRKWKRQLQLKLI